MRIVDAKYGHCTLVDKFVFVLVRFYTKNGDHSLLNEQMTVTILNESVFYTVCIRRCQSCSEMPILINMFLSTMSSSVGLNSKLALDLIRCGRCTN